MILALAIACRPEGTCRTPEEPPPDARVGVALTDFATGALALAGASASTGPLLATTGDPLVRAGDSGLYVVERGGADVLTALDPADPGCPIWQVALPDGTNAHDLVEHDGVLWVTSYDRPVLLGLSASDGELLHTVDLSSYAESDDGLPELDRLVLVDGRLWVAAQRFVRDGTIWRSTDGMLIAIDPAGPTVLDVVPTGPNPRIRAVGDGTIAVGTGLFARGPNDPDAELRRRDGDVRIFDPVGGVLGPPILVEAELDGDIGAVVPWPGGLVAVVVAPDASSRVLCLGPGGLLEGPSGPSWLVDGVWDGDVVVLASRRGLADDGVVPGGLLRLDPASCSEVSRLPTALDPIDVVRLPGR